MDQETRWLTKFKEVVDFIEANHRNPSKHRIEMYILVEVGNIRKNKKGLSHFIETGLLLFLQYFLYLVSDITF